MAPAIASTVVNRPAAEVFAYATGPHTFPRMAAGRRLTIAVDFDGFGIGRLLVPIISAAKHKRKCQPTSKP